MSLDKVLDSIILIMNDMEQEVSISVQKLNVIWIDGMKLYRYFLNDFVVLGDFVSAIL